MRCKVDANKVVQRNRFPKTTGMGISGATRMKNLDESYAIVTLCITQTKTHLRQDTPRYMRRSVYLYCFVKAVKHKVCRNMTSKRTNHKFYRCALDSTESLLVIVLYSYH